MFAVASLSCARIQPCGFLTAPGRRRPCAIRVFANKSCFPRRTHFYCVSEFLNFQSLFKHYCNFETISRFAKPATRKCDGEHVARGKKCGKTAHFRRPSSLSRVGTLLGTERESATSSSGRSARRRSKRQGNRDCPIDQHGSRTLGPETSAGRRHHTPTPDGVSGGCSSFLPLPHVPEKLPPEAPLKLLRPRSGAEADGMGHVPAQRNGIRGALSHFPGNNPAHRSGAPRARFSFPCGNQLGEATLSSHTRQARSFLKRMSPARNIASAPHHKETRPWVSKSAASSASSF